MTETVIDLFHQERPGERGSAYRLHLDTMEREDIRLTKDTILQRLHRPAIDILCQGALNPAYVQQTVRSSTFILLLYVHRELKGFILSHTTSDGGYMLDVLCSSPGHGGQLLSTFLSLLENGGAPYVTLNALTSVLSYYPRFGFGFRKTCNSNSKPNIVLPSNLVDWVRRTKPSRNALFEYPPYREFIDHVRRLGYSVDTDNDCDDLTISMNEFVKRKCYSSGFEMRKCFRRGSGGVSGP